MDEKYEFPRDVLQQIERHFHHLIEHYPVAGDLVREAALQLPRIEPLLELDDLAVWFQIPGYFGGFDSCLRVVNGEVALFSLIGSRMNQSDDPETKLHKITVDGVKVVATGSEAEWEFMKISRQHKKGFI